MLEAWCGSPSQLWLDFFNLHVFCLTLLTLLILLMPPGSFCCLLLSFGCCTGPTSFSMLFLCRHFPNEYSSTVCWTQERMLLLCNLSSAKTQGQYDYTG
jgi:hypothetical protein